MGISHILICNSSGATDYVNKTGKHWFTSPVGAGKPVSRAGLPRVNYAQELVVQAGRDPDDPAVLRSPTRGRANHPHAESRAVATQSGPDAAYRSFHCRHAGRAPPMRAVAAIPSAASPEHQLAPFAHAPPAARSAPVSVDPRAAAWCVPRAP